MTEKSFRERLIEKGAPKEYLDRFTEEELEQLKKDMEEEGATEEYVALLMKFRDFLEDYEKYKRKRISITLASPVYDLLKYIADSIVDAEGNPYPLSYVIEDALVWLLRNSELFERFLEETYTEGYADDTEEEEAKGSES